MSLERCVDAYQATNATAEMVQQSFAEDRRLDGNIGERRISEGPVEIPLEAGIEAQVITTPAEAVPQAPVLV